MEEERGFWGQVKSVACGGEPAFQNLPSGPTPIALPAVSTNCYMSIMGYDVLDLRLEFEKAEDHFKQQSGNGNVIGSSFPLSHISFPLYSFTFRLFCMPSLGKLDHLSALKQSESSQELNHAGD